MLTAADYERAAQEYLESLPLEHFMEATPQSKQREITIESFAILATRIPTFQYFGELLVQHLQPDETLVQVVPDNMVILSDEPDRKRTNFATALEKAPIFWVLEWVSDNTKGKDYGESFRKYEEVLQVPYCLMFHPDRQDLRLYRYNGEGYVRMEPDGRGRMLIDQLDLEVGMLDGWVRYWHKGELLPLPAELEQDRDRLRTELRERNEAMQLKEEMLTEHRAEIEARTLELKQQTERLARMEEMLRRQVEERARRAGRDDILARLATTDLAQLGAWLGELP